MLRLWLIAVLAIAVVVPFAAAQRRGGGFGYSHGFSHGGSRSTHRGYSAWPYLYSDFYPDNDTTPPYDEAGAPPVFILQRAPAGSPADDAPASPKPRPLLIEWHGDHYVRYGGVESQIGSGISAQADYSESAGVSKSSPVAELPQPVLVYRDGRREQISDYTIADGVIYLRSNGWQNGNWTKRVPLSMLDMNATLLANQQLGAKFLLPTAPNVVVASF